MTLLLENYAAALIAALLIGVVVAYWAFRRAGDKTLGETPPPIVETPPPAVASEPAPVVETAPLAPPEAPIQPPAATGPADDLQTLKGVGAKFAAQLNANGITRFDQLAALSMGEVAELDERMGAFKGRLLRDRVVEQATFLARGDRAGFEAAFGKLGSGA